MQIREMTHFDIKQVAQLFDAYRMFYSYESSYDEAHNFIEQRFLNQESKVFVAENELRQIVGFTQLFSLFSSTRMNKLILLNDLFVHQDHRSKGISKLLIDRAKAFCKEVNACGLSLETEKTNIIGNHLYPSQGFKLDEENNFYFWTSL
jgi:GNAT superfamily N-acetyltransferase